MNKKGFTLVELLAVIVILVAILMIAIPTITSSMERSKEKQLEQKKKLIVTAAEEIVSSNKNDLTGKTICKVPISKIINEGLLQESELDDPTNPGNLIGGCVVYTIANSSYVFSDSCSNVDCVQN